MPTEAQWEKAARWDSATGHSDIYSWGDIWDREKCNNYYDHTTGYQWFQTAPAGSYPTGVSPYGLYDMAGNAEEWCLDWYTSYPGSPSRFDYTNTLRVIRGEDFYASPDDGRYYRCAKREGIPPDSSQPNYHGIRLVR